MVAGLTGNAVDDVKDASVIVDDILDSGRTYEKWHSKYPDKKFYALFNRKADFKGDWVVFPWEENLEADYQDTLLRLAQMVTKDKLDAAIEAIDETIKHLQNEV